MKPILKEITVVNEDDMFVLLDYPNNKFDYPTHYHEDLEINLVYNTCGIRVIGDELQEFHDFDLVMLGPGVYHSWHGKEEFKEAHVSTIQFRKEVFSEQILAKKEFRAIKKMLEDSACGIQFSEKTAKRMIPLFNDMVDDNSFTRVLKFYNILNELATDTYSCILKIGKTSQPITKHHEDSIQQVCNYIHSNYNKDIPLMKVAQIANLSISGFNYFFKKCTHKSYVNYLMNYRISQSALMLIETDCSVSEISYKNGFSSPSYYNRVFFKIKGMTPSEYRQRMKKLI